MPGDEIWIFLTADEHRSTQMEERIRGEKRLGGGEWGEVSSLLFLIPSSICVFNVYLWFKFLNEDATRNMGWSGWRVAVMVCGNSCVRPFH
jgi:hypothetical protein